MRFSYTFRHMSSDKPSIFPSRIPCRTSACAANQCFPYTTMSMSHYLFELSFQKNPNFGYGAALAYVILIMVALLAAIQMKVGDKRD